MPIEVLNLILKATVEAPAPSADASRRTGADTVSANGDASTLSRKAIARMVSESLKSTKER